MELLVIILNYNGLEHTLACLDSLYRQTFSDFSIQVIDNGSRSDDLGRISSRFPGTEVVALPVNTGWAGGNNIGLEAGRRRQARYVCLLNNDTVLDPDAIEELLRAADAFGKPCLLHPRIAYFDDPTRWQIDPQPNDVDVGRMQDIVEMDFAYGACLLFPGSLLDSIGLLDERFFLQLEETDYFHRARARGVPSLCAKRARMLHKESATFGGRISPDKTYYQVRNSFLIAEKHACTPVGFMRTVRSLSWALYHQARMSDPGVDSWFGFLRWLGSADPLARAARQGGGDYVRRRFGRRSS